jgi:hypothetical protein
LATKVDDYKYKTTDKIKLRVTEASTETATADPLPGAPATNEPQTAEPTKAQAGLARQHSDSSMSPDAARVKAHAPDDLLDIIADPHANEDEWVSACHELDKQKRNLERDGKRRRHPGRRTWGILAACLVSAAIGAASYFHLGPFTPPQVDYQPYMTSLQQEIKSHWKPPKDSKSTKITIHFKVHENGDISDIGFDRLAPGAEADAAALKSVIESMPALPPLPKGSPDVVDVQFHFDYNVTKTDNHSAPLLP